MSQSERRRARPRDCPMEGRGAVFRSRVSLVGRWRVSYGRERGEGMVWKRWRENTYLLGLIC